MLEDQGKVGLVGIGNCAVRRFALRDLVDLAQVEAEKDHNVFRTAEGVEEYTHLNFGNSVLSPEMIDGAGRSCRYAWCMMDEARLVMPG